MSTEPERPSDADPTGPPTTFVYDAAGTRWTADADGVHTFDYDVRGDAASTRPPPPLPIRAPEGRAQPVHLQTFEFRLTASEAQEQCVAVGNPRSGHYIAATRCVRAYLTRTGDPGAASSEVGGIEVHAELRDGNLVCAAALSAFGPGDLVVVQVKAALYERCTSAACRAKKRVSRKAAKGA